MKPNQVLETKTARTGRSAARWLVEGGSLSNLAGLSLTGTRAAAWVSDGELVTQSGCLRSSARRHLPFVVHLASTGSTGHGAYHGAADAGCFELFAADAQEAADLSLIAHRIAELSLVPGILAQDAPAAFDALESVSWLGDEAVGAFLGRPDDFIDCPTPAQRQIFGGKRRRLPEYWSVENPMMTGAVYGDDSRAARAAANAPFFLAHVAELADLAFAEFGVRTGRVYRRFEASSDPAAEFLILAQGRAVRTAEAVAAHLKRTAGTAAGVVNLRMLRPFPGKALSRILKGRSGVLVLERAALTVDEDAPLTRAVRTALAKHAESSSIPRLYTAFMDLAAAEPAPGAVVAAFENMMKGGRSRVQLSVRFFSAAAATPQQEIQETAIRDAYPEAASLALADAPEPRLAPDASVLVEFEGADADSLRRDGGRFAEEAARLLGWTLAARPAGRGYRIAVSPEPMRVLPGGPDCDAVFALSAPAGAGPGPAAFLKPGGILILQSRADSSERAWEALPAGLRSAAVEKKAAVYFADLEGLAGAPDRDFAKALLGCWSVSADRAGLPMIAERRKELGRDPDFKRGAAALVPIPEPDAPAPEEFASVRPELPAALRRRPRGAFPAADIHRFYAQTGHRYAAGSAPKNLADPFIGSGLVPGATGILRDLSGERSAHPVLNPEKCTGCGDCWMICPDAALPARVNPLSEVLEAGVSFLQAKGHELKALDDALRPFDGILSSLLEDAGGGASFPGLFTDAVRTLLRETPPERRERLEHELTMLRDAVGRTPFCVSEEFFVSSGGLLSIAIDPDRCKGCLSCVRACRENALAAVVQTPATLEALRSGAAFASALPPTGPEYIRGVDDGEDGRGPETLLLDRDAYEAVTGGHDGAPGSASRTVSHLFAGAAAAVYKARLRKRIARAGELIAVLGGRLKEGLSIDAAGVEALSEAARSLEGGGISLNELAARFDLRKEPVDADWLKRVAVLLGRLKRWTESAASEAPLGAVVGGATESSRYPYHPFSFPCTRLDRGVGPDLALGLFEGHMRKMAGIVSAFRAAELEADGKYNPAVHDEYFASFDWRDFTEEEFRACPPVVVIVGARDLYGAGFGALSALLSSGVPVKVLSLDSLEGPANAAVAALSHPGVFVMQGGLGDLPRLMEGFAAGLSAKRPALFNVHCSRIAEERGGSPAAAERGRDALASRAIPSFVFDPGRGRSEAECLNLGGNAEPGADWTERELVHSGDGGADESLRVPYTFADFAAAERAFEGDFTPVPGHLWTRSMVPVHEFIEMEPEGSSPFVPYISAVDGLGRLRRLAVSDRMVEMVRARLAAWNALKRIKRLDAAKEEDIEARVRSELVETVARSLSELAL